ncbi:hypothetical protein ABZ815_29980 [Nonomuraea sp. NPDC047529]
MTQEQHSALTVLGGAQGGLVDVGEGDRGAGLGEGAGGSIKAV